MKLLIKCLVIFTFFIFIQGSKYVIDPALNAVMHNNKGLEFLKDGYYVAAAMEFKLAISLNPESAASATFYNNLGLTYMKLQRQDWAISSFERAIALNPNFLEYYRNLVKAYKTNNVLNREVNKSIEIIKKDKSNSRVWLLLGLMYIELKYNYDAVLCLNKFKELEPDLLLSQEVENIISKLKL
jgi:tetratricopeptide (TPR) repeat protein